MLATTAAQNASVTAKTPHRGVSLRCVQLPSLADRQNAEKPPLGWLFTSCKDTGTSVKRPEGNCSCILHGKNHMLTTAAAQNASVTAKTPHRGVSLRCVQLPSLADRQNAEKPPQGWLFHVLVDPRGVEPLSENPLGRLSSWAVCYEVLPGGAQTDTRHRTGSPFLDDRLKDETPMHLPC